MEARDPKPRMKVDLKTALVILGFLGFGSIGSLWLGAQRLAFFLLAGSFEKQAVADSLRTERQIHANNEQIMFYVGHRFDRLETYVVKVPGVLRSFTVAERQRLQADSLRLEKERVFPPPPFERISR